MKSYKQTELGVIPADWDVAPLSELCDIATGNTPPTSNKDYYGDDYLFVSPADLGSLKYIIQTSKRLSSLGFAISRKYPSNSILFTCIGSTIGKCGITTSIATSNQQINAVFPSQFINHEYLYYQLVKIAPQIKVRAGEQAVPIVNKTEFGTTIIPVPDMFEQKAIATILSDMDLEIGAIETKLIKARQLKQGMMHELLTGKIRLIDKGNT